MANFKLPDFNERTAAALAAKERALEKLRAKAAPDPAVIAERQAKQAAREQVAAERRAARLAAIAEEKAMKLAAQEAAAAAAVAAAELEEASRPGLKEKPELSPEEQKAIRDARYAARKARKR